jgi:glycosyltransferase involved in cell wall biosynthesis
MKLSACVITKNEEVNLPTCLQSIQSIVQEIIVVDTGSTDSTIEVAKSFGAHVFQIPWENDFSKAKNYALDRATGDWVIFLDADEYFTADSTPLIPQVIQEAEEKNCDMIISLLSNYDTATKQMSNSIHHVRIFRNHPDIRYTGAIHERVVKAGETPKALNAMGALKIIHTGYSEKVYKTKDKRKRNLELLLEELKKNPESGNIHFYLAETYVSLHQYEQGLYHAEKVLELKNTTLLGIMEKNYLNLITCLIQLQREKEEIVKRIKEAITKFPDYPDFYIYLGDVYLKEHRLYDALEAYTNGMRNINNAFQSQSNVPHQAPKILDLIGQLYYKTNQIHESVNSFVKALQIDRYEYPVLCNLLLLFTKYESVPNSISFLKKLYDFTNKKDLLFLAKASLQAKNVELAAYFLQYLGGESEPALQEEYAELYLLQGHYRKAAKLFLVCAESGQNESLSIRAVTSAFLTEDSAFTEHVCRQVRSPLVYIVERQRKISSQPEKQAILQLINVLAYLSKDEKICVFEDLIHAAELTISVGKVLYEYERYDMAAKYFRIFLDRHSDLDSSLLAELLYLLGDCLYRTGRLAEAKRLAWQSVELRHEDYRPYSLLLKITADENETVEIGRVVEEALQVFPDSSFLRSLQSILNHR